MKVTPTQLNAALSTSNEAITSLLEVVFKGYEDIIGDKVLGKIVIACSKTTSGFDKQRSQIKNDEFNDNAVQASIRHLQMSEDKERFLAEGNAYIHMLFSTMSTIIHASKDYNFSMTMIDWIIQSANENREILKRVKQREDSASKE